MTRSIRSVHPEQVPRPPDTRPDLDVYWAEGILSGEYHVREFGDGLQALVEDREGFARIIAHEGDIYLRLDGTYGGAADTERMEWFFKGMLAYILLEAHRDTLVDWARPVWKAYTDEVS